MQEETLDNCLMMKPNSLECGINCETAPWDGSDVLPNQVNRTTKFISS
jgi:hypothetical protein